MNITSCESCNRKRCTACYATLEENIRKQQYGIYVLCMDKRTGRSYTSDSPRKADSSDPTDGIHTNCGGSVTDRPLRSEVLRTTRDIDVGADWVDVLQPPSFENRPLSFENLIEIKR